MSDSFMHNHQSALDSQREDDAIQYLQDTGGLPWILMINFFLWRLIMSKYEVRVTHSYTNYYHIDANSEDEATT